jgi:small subunit ribosomal protein S14
MAKKSKIARNKQVEHRKKALELSGEKRVNRVSTRVRNRCKICGRPHGYMRFFGVCRLCFRELAARGELAGVTKASK